MTNSGIDFGRDDGLLQKFELGLVDEFDRIDDCR